MSTPDMISGFMNAAHVEIIVKPNYKASGGEDENKSGYATSADSLLSERLSYYILPQGLSETVLPNITMH